VYRRTTRSQSKTSVKSPGISDPAAFVDDVYRRLLGRPADPEGLRHHIADLAAGVSPAEIVMSFATSEEYRRRILASVPESLRKNHSERYRFTRATGDGDPFWAFDVRDDADFDWLEQQIIANGYYEQVGVWGLELDDDKRIMGELLASLEPERALEIGCSSGTVLGVLVGHGVDAEGIEISRMAYDRADPAVRPRIHVGDLLELELPSDFDLVFGLDVFEHLNPNRLAEYCAAAFRRLRPGGHLFANIPAYGRDDVFGEVFPVYVDEWHDDIAKNRPFRVLHCDDAGYPMHGHLIWAHTDWWVAQFERAGFERRPEVERDLHARYADHFRAAPARSSFYVFRSRPEGPRTE
jgi:SAM-dependent methyltransferase